MTRFVRIQLTIFTIASVIGMTVMIVEYLQVPTLLGVGRMCGLVIEDLEEMDAADYQRLKARFLEYLGVAGQPVVGNGAAGEVVSVSAERD